MKRLTIATKIALPAILALGAGFSAIGLAGNAAASGLKVEIVYNDGYGYSNHANRNHRVFTKRSSWISAGPGYHYPRIDRVFQGQELRVHGCLFNYSWCEVSRGITRGWIESNELVTVRDRRNYSFDSIYHTYPVISFILDRYWSEHYRHYNWYHDKRWRNFRDNRNDGYKGRYDRHDRDDRDRFNRDGFNRNDDINDRNRLDKIRDNRNNNRDNLTPVRPTVKPTVRPTIRPNINPNPIDNLRNNSRDTRNPDISRANRLERNKVVDKPINIEP